MNQLREITSLLSYSDLELQQLDLEQNAVLNANGDLFTLKREIKSFLDQMYSCLDYLAFEISNTFDGNHNIEKIRFPLIRYIPDEDATGSEVRLLESIRNNLGKECASNQDLVSKLRNCQHVYHQNHNCWVTDFKFLRNTNAHRHLSKVQQATQTNRVVECGIHKIVFKGPQSGIVDFSLGTNSFISSKEDLSNYFKRPIAEEMEHYISFDDVKYEMNRNALEFLKLIQKNVKEIVIDISSLIHLEHSK